MNSGHQPDFDEGEADDWAIVARALEAFSHAWEAGEFPPDLQTFANVPHQRVRTVLVWELVKLDLENRWQRGLRRLVEDYLDDFPDLRSRLTADILFEEYQIRRNAGDRAQASEYFQRFPELASHLEQWLRLDPAMRSTCVSRPGPKMQQSLSPGDTIDDFELLLKLGQGGFAAVFLARQKSMQRLVALKVSADQGTEPQTLAQLDHENIIRVYDQRMLPDRSVRLLYMQYAAGGTLADVIQRLADIPVEQRDGRSYLQAIDELLETRGEFRPAESAVRQQLAELSWPELVCWLGVRLARALDYAHRCGILHRDIKPANVLLTAEGIPRLADFNISYGAGLEGTTAESFLGGSFAYMSPEQREACDPRHGRAASELDGRSDLFSLAVVLHELLEGVRPPLVWRSASDHPANGQEETAGDGEIATLSGVLQRCLSAEPVHRFGSGSDLAFALEICGDADAQRLLNDQCGGWKRFIRRWPLLSVVLITLLPNLVTAIFNFLYNRGEILNAVPAADAMFMRIQLFINLTAFPVGILSSRWLVQHVTEAIGRAVPAQTSAELTELRRQCLNLGTVAAMTGLTLWLLAAPVYPVLLHLFYGDVPLTIWGHFVISLTLCGLIAAAYPFFGVSLIGLRCLYPRLFRRGSIHSGDVEHVQRLSRVAWLHLFLAAAVPMFAVLVLSVTGLERRFALIVLAAGGTLGFGCLFAAFRILQQDLSTLQRVMLRLQGAVPAKLRQT